MASKTAKRLKRNLYPEEYNNKINTNTIKSITNIMEDTTNNKTNNTKDISKEVYDKNLLLKAVDDCDVRSITNIISLNRDTQSCKNIALCNVSRKGTSPVFSWLTKYGIDRSDDSCCATRKSYLDIAKLLIEYGADVNYNQCCALRDAARNGNTDICILLIEHGANIKTYWNSVMCNAVRNADIKLVKYILQCERPYRVKYGDILGNTMWNPNLEIIRLIIEEIGLNIKYYKEHLLSATYSLGDSHIDILDYLIEKGVDLGRNFDSILRSAIIRKHYKMQEYLISHGEGLYIGPKTIIAAAESNNIRMLDYLVNKGVNIEPIKDYPIYFNYKYNMYGKLEMTSCIIDNSEVVHKRHYDCGISDKYPQLTDYEYNILSSMQMVLDLRDNMYLNII